MKKLNNIPNWSIAAIMLIMTLISSNIHWSKEDSWKNIVGADAKGYYAYMPAVFVYQDLNFGFFDNIEKEKYFNKSGYYDYRSYHKGKVINKYFVGTAVAQAPFFICAHLLSGPLGFDSDGYSKPYLISVTISSLFYLLLGLIFLSKTLNLYKIERWNNAIVLITFVFGSNLFCYSVIDNGFSHTYSFAFIAIFMYYVKRYFQYYKPKYIFYIAITLGLIVLIRPVNGLVIFSIPFLSGSKKELKEGFSHLIGRFKIATILASILAFVIVSIQLVIYKISTGSFLVFSYGEEGFNFLSPHMIDILFSYRKGLFLYTPIFLVSLFGTYSLYKKSKFESITLSAFLILVVYVLSSWWNWWYGGSFSSRVFVEYIPFFAILLGLLLKYIQQKIKRRMLLTVIALLIIICQIQTYQFRYYFIHYEEMDMEKYWDVFLRVDLLF